jgi:hypothetical protein
MTINEDISTEGSMGTMQLLGLLSSLGAAVFWGWSATIVVPDLMRTKISGAGSVTDIMKRQSQLSAIGAFLAAISIVFQALA